MNDQKVCESAYLAAADPETGPYLHGAAMVDRSAGTPHIWLVRGPCSTSVVDELQRQLIKSGRLQQPAVRMRRGHVTSLTALALGLFAAGLHALLLGFTGPR